MTQIKECLQIIKLLQLQLNRIVKRIFEFMIKAKLLKETFFYYLLVILVIGSSYNNDKKFTIYLQEYNYVFTPQKIGCLDTLVEKLEDGRRLKIFLFDCMGKMHIECYKGKSKVEEGNYTGSLDLLKKYIFLTNGHTGKTHVKVSEYYQPLRSGDWFFYDIKGLLLTKKNYKQGVLQ